MTERMTNEKWDVLISEEEWTTDELGDVLEEACRARRSEEETGATIKALADALEKTRNACLAHHHAEVCRVDDETDPEDLEGCSCVLRLVPGLDAALRLAARFK